MKSQHGRAAFNSAPGNELGPEMAGQSGAGSFSLARGAHAARAVHNPMTITARGLLMVKAPSQDKRALDPSGIETHRSRANGRTSGAK